MTEPLPRTQASSRWGLALSLLLHLLLVLGLYPELLSDRPRREAEPERSMEVDLVKDPPPAKNKPPEPEKKPEEKKPEPEKKPEEKKPEEKKPEPPRPEPEKKPEEPKPKPEPPKPERKPEPKPQPPKPQPPPPQAKPAQPRPHPPAASTPYRPPQLQGGTIGEHAAAPQPSTSGPAIALGDRTTAFPVAGDLSQTAQDFILAQFLRMWRFDTAGGRGRGLQMSMTIIINPDGTLAGDMHKDRPWNPDATIADYRRLPSAYFRDATESMLLAIRMAQPLTLPPDDGKGWPRRMVLTFRFDDL